MIIRAVRAPEAFHFVILLKGAFSLTSGTIWRAGLRPPAFAIRWRKMRGTTSIAPFVFYNTEAFSFFFSLYFSRYRFSALLLDIGTLFSFCAKEHSVCVPRHASLHSRARENAWFAWRLVDEFRWLYAAAHISALPSLLAMQYFHCIMRCAWCCLFFMSYIYASALSFYFIIFYFAYKQHFTDECSLGHSPPLAQASRKLSPFCFSRLSLT